MSITVADCLKLTSLREARVVAGFEGLNKIVVSVSASGAKMKETKAHLS